MVHTHKSQARAKWQMFLMTLKIYIIIAAILTFSTWNMPKPWLGFVGFPPHFDCIRLPLTQGQTFHVSCAYTLLRCRLVFAIFTLKFHNFHFYTLWYHFYHIFCVLLFGPSHHNLVSVIKMKIELPTTTKQMRNFNLAKKLKLGYLCKHLKYSLAFF